MKPRLVSRSPIAMITSVLITACGADSGNISKASGGAQSGVGGARASGGSVGGSNASGGVANGGVTEGTPTGGVSTGGKAYGGTANGGTANGGTANGGTANGGTANGGMTTSGGTTATGGRQSGGSAAVGGDGGGASARGGAPAAGGSAMSGGFAAVGGGSGWHYYASPTGTGTACSSAAPCSITDAQTVVRTAVKSMQGDVIVELADGTYTLKAPLVFSAADSGNNGHTVIWQAATGAHPVLSGAQKVTGWALSDSGKNIWKASASGAFATRQLFVDGKLATRARLLVNRSDLTFNNTGFKFSSAALSVLNSLAHPERTELHAVGSFTDRYSPVQSIVNGTSTMVQPAWANNIWGWDTLQSPFRASNVWVENAYELLDQGGEWYLDTSVETLFYKPLTGQDMAKADVELPQLEVLMVVAGTYDQPTHDLAFSGLTFSHTSWLGPNSTDGYACQQTNAFIHGSGYAEFEATRPKWYQMPAAVQVSAAKNISFIRDRFAALGQVGLGIGNDENAHFAKVGLGTDTISITGCVFNQIAAGAVVLGGIQENAHHPSDPRMVNQNSTISNNLIHDIGIDYRDSAGILFTYTKKVVVSHNEVYNIPYSGIASGYGWGANDAGGSNDYANRGLYKYQTRYTTATTAQDNQIVANYLHDGMQQMNDGGCHYNLSANPGTIVTQNYCKGGWPNSVGDYQDEGSRYVTITKNIFSGWGTWVFANANANNNTGDLTFTNNWISGGANIGGRNNTVTGNVTVGATLPADAQAVANAAGLEAAYADLKTSP